MTKKEIKANTPDGATHYGSDGGYLKIEWGEWFVWNNIDNDWMKIIPNKAWFEKYQYKPLLEAF